RLASLLRPSDQPLLAHDGCDGLLADPPAVIAQLIGDPRRTPLALMRGEALLDGDRQLLAPGPPRRGIPVPPLVVPRLADRQRPAAGGIWDAMLRPLGGHEAGRRHTPPTASLTQR